MNERCDLSDCTFCRLDKEGCSCKTSDKGCWVCEPTAFKRPECAVFLLAKKKILYNGLEKEIQRVIEHYGVKSGRLSDHVYEKLEAVFASKTYEEAQRRYDRMMKYTIWECANSLWAAKKALGPPHSRFTPSKIAKAENLAEMLEKKGDLEGAERTRLKVEQLREDAENMEIEG